MSNDAGQEPSMEEILASIRKIISEDGEEDGAKEAVAEAEREPKPKLEPDPEIDMLERTEEFDEVPLPTPIESDGFEDELILDEEYLVSAETTAAGASSFAGLAGALDPNIRTGNLDRTLEALVKEVMRPLLRDWLESNLPVIVERCVKREIKKMATKPK
jgi:cell pole-organizing protein PopZ